MTNETNKFRAFIDTNIFMSVVHREDFIQFLEEREYSHGVYTVIEVLMELDNLKTKEGKAGFEARRAIKLIKWMLDNKYLEVEHKNMAEVLELFENNRDKRMGFADEIIIESCVKARKEEFVDAEIISNDISMGLLAKAFDIGVIEYHQSENTFILDESVTEIRFSDVIQEPGYETLSKEKFLDGSFIDPDIFNAGDYIILDYADRGQKSEILYVRENGIGKKELNRVGREYLTLVSTMFGAVRPKERDDYQACLIDSFNRNPMTAVTGPAGTGKTFLSLAAIFSWLDNNEIDKIIVVTNPEDTKDGAKLGYYKGDMLDKLLQKSIGGILESKLGGKDGVRRYIDNETLILKTINDLRGYELPPNSVLYISEAQNFNVNLMKLAIQRVPENSKVIIEGDPETQLDNYIYEGHNNGMLKMLEVFTGTGVFGHVDLKRIYRSNIANIAEKMTE